MLSNKYTREMIEFILDKTIPEHPVPRGKKKELYDRTAHLFNQSFPEFPSGIKNSQVKYIVDHFGNSAEYGNRKANVIHRDPIGPISAKANAGASNSTQGPKPATAQSNGRRCIVCPHCNGKGTLEAYEKTIDPPSTPSVITSTPITPFMNPTDLTMGSDLYHDSPSSSVGLPTKATLTRPAPLAPNSQQNALWYGPMVQQNESYPLVTAPVVHMQPAIREGREGMVVTNNTHPLLTGSGTQTMNNTRRRMAVSSDLGLSTAAWTGRISPTAQPNFDFEPNTAPRAQQTPRTTYIQSQAAPQSYPPVRQNRPLAMKPGTPTPPARGQPIRFQHLDQAGQGVIIPPNIRFIPRADAVKYGLSKEPVPPMGKHPNAQVPGAATRSNPLKRPRTDDEINVGGSAASPGYNRVQGRQLIENRPALKRPRTTAGKSSSLIANAGISNGPPGLLQGQGPDWDDLNELSNSFFSDEVGLGMSYDQSRIPMGNFVLNHGRNAGNGPQVSQSLARQDAIPAVSNVAEQNIGNPEAAQDPQALAFTEEEFDIVKDFCEKYGDGVDQANNDVNNDHVVTGETFSNDLFTNPDYPDLFG
ncbi:hypothetical protein F5Y11DRAFT_363224 [Daldinia sp. FL1419]|nr:hypothetical protein F5Y11DRAFT_363224 [Daldinia sp. FL1419]